MSRDELADAIWAERPPRIVGGSLNALVSKLRKALGTGVVEGTACLQLTELASVDLDDARDAVHAACAGLRDHDYACVSEQAAWAAALAGRGVAVDHEAEWLEEQRHEVEELRLQALEYLGEAGLGLGGTGLADARHTADMLISAAAFRESGYLLKMRALWAEGNAAEAVRVYHELRRTLDDELGVLPSAPVQELADRLLLGDEAPAAAGSAPTHVGDEARLLGAGVVAAPHFATRTHARFVGRTHELERLRTLLEQARLRGRHLVLLEGEPGIGKTRLVEQFARSCRTAGVVVLAGRCDVEAIMPYQPFLQALRPYVASIPARELRERLGVHAEELSGLLPELASNRRPADDLGHHADRYRLFEAFAELLTESTRTAPVALILDDLQWADRPTLMMLRHLARIEEDTPLLIIGIYRDTERDAALLETLADLRREHFFETLRLSGLAEEEAGELIAAVSQRSVHATAERALWRETKGNPFFLEEIVRNLDAGKEDVAAVPEGVRTVIRRRLAHHSDDVNRMLVVAAVAGAEFSLELLEHVSELAELSGDRLYDALDEAIAAGLLIETPDAERYLRFAFSHSLMRQTIYSDVTLARRGRLHLSIGAALETLTTKDGTAHLAELAHHYLAAPPSHAAEKAILYATGAAHQAVSVLAFEEAERLYGLALAAIERHDGENSERRKLLLALGDVQVKRGAIDVGRATFAHALALAREDDDAEPFALAALGLGARSYMAGGVVDQELIAILDEALDRLPAAASPLRARVLARLADELSFSERRERCESLSQQAVAVARRLDDPRAYCFALSSRHWCLWGPENLQDRLEAARELLALGERTGHKASVIEGHRWCLQDLLELGDIAAVDAEIKAYTSLAHERRLASELWYVPLFRAMRMLLAGRLAEAEQAAAEAFRRGHRVQPANAEQAHTLQMVALPREQGRLAEMEHDVRERARRYPTIPGWRCLLAYLYAQTGQADKAAHELDALAADGFQDIPHDGIWLGAITCLAETCAATGARTHAATLYDLLAPYADRNVVIGWASTCAGPAARHLGLLASLLGRHSTAAAHFEDAIAMNGAMGARLWLARTRLQYAQALGASPHSQDQQRARSMLHDALATAQELDLSELANSITDTLTTTARGR